MLCVSDVFNGIAVNQDYFIHSLGPILVIMRLPWKVVVYVDSKAALLKQSRSVSDSLYQQHK